VFCLDSSKQIAGAGWIHVANMFCAMILGKVAKRGDQCEWYWIEIMLDTTLGVAVEYYLLFFWPLLLESASVLLIRRR